MSYDPNPAHYVNGSFIIWHLVDVVAKGGLMQIGYGPVRGGTRATRGGTDGTRVARGWYGGGTECYGLMQIGYGPVRGGTRATRGHAGGTEVVRSGTV